MEEYPGFSSSHVPVIHDKRLREILPLLNLCDVGFNSMDSSFRGHYHGKHAHSDDLEHILQRAASLGVKSMLCTSSGTKESRKTIQFVKDCNNKPCKLQATVGIHPVRCGEFQHGVEPVISQLRQLIDQGLAEGVVAAIGECGLDYDRLFLCSKELQMIGFTAQLELAKEYNLPLFLHSRNTGGDFLRILSDHLPDLPAKGVVHSYTGNIEELMEICALGMYVSVNGCSMKTEEGIEVIRRIPEHLLLLETDAPWCGVKKTHVSSLYVTTSIPCVKKEKFVAGAMVKDRNEPCTMIHVLEAVAKIRGVDPLSLANSVMQNTVRLFPRLQH